MSGSQTPAALSAREIDARAADWLQRREFWDWSDADQAALDEWLAQSWANRVAYHRLEAAWSRTNRLAALSGYKRENEEERGGARFLLRAAAAFALVAVMGASAAVYIWQPKAKAYSTGTGERETLSLPDGSQIELNTNTSLRILATPTERQVWLDKGEAYFSIMHNPKRPFTVWTANKRVTDIGTKFVVRQDASRLELAVMEGRVGVASASDAHSARNLQLSQGDILVATANASSVTRKAQRKIANDFSWRQGMLVFDDVPFSKVVAEFNRYSTEKLVVADDTAARTRVSATFPINGVEDFVKLAHRVLGLRVERRDGETVISRPQP
ncbi:MAG TPA: FecR domain-containing protein [Rhizomicrobium sp.]|nr:FecR domain-containing protein [Rhizomicrobium sp.]